MSLSKVDKNVKKRIIEASRSIRKKYLALKLERNEEDEALDKLLNPITEPLKKLVDKTAAKKSKTRNKRRKIKEEEEEIPKPEMKFETVDQRGPPAATASFKYQPTEVIAEAEDDDEDDEVFVPSTQTLQEDLHKSIIEQPGAYRDFLEQYPQIAREFIDMYYTNSERIDHSRGLKLDIDTETWNIGSQRVDFLPNGDVKVGDITYPGTRGLYELLFYKEPLYPTKDDGEYYRDILTRSNVHRVGYKPDGRVKGSTSTKYLNIIKPLTTASEAASKLRKQSSTSISPASNRSTRSQSKTSAIPKKSGSALMRQYNNAPKQYVYYDDVNELVERFVKLDASQEAGNGNHMNEILSILEELEELGVIGFYK